MGQERAVARPSRAPQTLAVLAGVLARIHHQGRLLPREAGA